LTDAELTTFAESVKTRAVEVFQERYRGVADIAVTASDSSDTHIISMIDIEDTLFGQSPFDCGSLVAKQTTEVHVGPIAET